MKRLIATALTVTMMFFASPAFAGDDYTEGDDDRWTSVYLYQKVDPTREASWENSGSQTLVQTIRGWTWDVSPDLSPLCGDGWSLQIDQTEGIGEADLPRLIDRATGVGVLGWPPVIDAKHIDLLLPECPIVVDPPVIDEPPVAPPATPAPQAPKFTG